MTSKKLAICAFSFAVVFASGLGVGPASGAGNAPPQNVQVTNTPANPVPVTLQGSSNVTGNVTVGNTLANPVPVTGTVTVNSLPAVSGTVGISGTPSVSITNTPAVTSGDHTDLVFNGDVTANGTFTSVFSADLTQYKTVKLIVTCFVAGCPALSARIYEVFGAESMLIDEVALPASVLPASVRLYDLPGTGFSVQLVNANTGMAPTAHFALLGRRN